MGTTITRSDISARMPKISLVRCPVITFLSSPPLITVTHKVKEGNFEHRQLHQQLQFTKVRR